MKNDFNDKNIKKCGTIVLLNVNEKWFICYYYLKKMRNLKDFQNKSIVINVNEEFLSKIFVGSVTDNDAR
jgi:hypothetical protein